MSSRYELDEGCLAVVGMACRMPGASSLDIFWDNLLAGRISRERIDDEELATSIHAELRHDPDYIPVRSSLTGYDMFDAGFFKISPREASIMDPQHRLALECAWRAFENAGHVPEDKNGHRTGVFASSDMSSYFAFNLMEHLKNGRVEITEAIMGNDKDYLATRIAYKNNLKGPAYTIQAACSSSLVSLHAASQALLAEECDRALVVSATVLLPNLGNIYIPGGMRSPDGHCRAFDADANGTLFSNGVAAVLLRRYADAREAGDHIWAVVRASAANNDGSNKVGFSAPGLDGQTDVIRTALSAGGVAPEDVAYIEAHGTGTPMGDPVEVAALLQAYRPGETARSEPVILGSLKGNIGHLDATAGLGSFIKACLSLYHGIVPGTAHFKKPNPEFGNMSPLTVSSNPAALKRRGDTPLLAGISAFGFGGTNVHVILQERPAITPRKQDNHTRLLLFSAPHKDSLKAVHAEAGEFFSRSDGADGLLDTAYTLATGRRHFSARSVILAKNTKDAADQLNSENVPVRVASASELPVAFLFPGQGNLHARAAMHFYRDDDLFRKNLDGISSVIQADGGPDVIETLRQCRADKSCSADLLGRTDMAQPVLYALEYAFAATLMAKGIRPSCLVGHSLGEYAAAAVAGVFSPEDGARLVVRRGRIMQSAPPGKMLVVSLGASRLREVLGDLYAQVDLAVLNSPSNSVLSGSEKALGACAEAVEACGQRSTLLNTSHGFHSKSMECIMEPFRKELERISFSPPQIPLAGNLTGEWAGEELATPEYWLRHMRSPVQFMKCLSTLKSRAGIGIEVGPGSVLRSLAMHQGDSDAVKVIAGLDPLEAAYLEDEEADVLRRSCLDVAGDLWMSGGSVDWDAFYADEQAQRCPLPGVVLQPKRYWIEPGTAGMDEQTAADQAQSSTYERSVSSEYVEPKTDTERKLAEIWQQLFMLKSVGVHDEFLELGGNSIQIMQMIRSAAAQGLRFSAKDVFEGKDIAGLSERVTQVTPQGDTAPGPVHIPPYVVNWCETVNHTAFLAGIAPCPEGFGRADVEKLATALAQRHDALRMVWTGSGMELLGKNARNWAAQNVEDHPDPLDDQNFAALFAEGEHPLLQGCLAPIQGKSWRLMQFTACTSKAAPSRSYLLFSIWRALADEASMRVLKRDMAHFMKHGRMPDQTSSSWKQWADVLAGEEFARKSVSLKSAWEDVRERILKKTSLPPTEKASQETAGYEVFSFPMPEAARRLHAAADMCRLSLPMLATAAVVYALSQRDAIPGVLHCHTPGREKLFHIDPASSVGAYSYRFPLPMPKLRLNPEDMVPYLKESLAELPSYGQAAWLGDTGDIPSEVTFNGLPLIWSGTEHFEDGSVRAGTCPFAQGKEKGLTIYCTMDDGALRVHIANPARSNESAVDARLAEEIFESLQILTEDVAQRGQNCRYVPADFPYAGLKKLDLERILAQLGEPAPCAG